MEQKDTCLIFLKEKVGDGILTSTVALSVELGLLVLTWVSRLADGYINLARLVHFRPGALFRRNRDF